MRQEKRIHFTVDPKKHTNWTEYFTGKDFELKHTHPHSLGYSCSCTENRGGYEKSGSDNHIWVNQTKEGPENDEWRRWGLLEHHYYDGYPPERLRKMPSSIDCEYFTSIFIFEW